MPNGHLGRIGIFCGAKICQAFRVAICQWQWPCGRHMPGICQTPRQYAKNRICQAYFEICQAYAKNRGPFRPYLRMHTFYLFHPWLPLFGPQPPPPGVGRVGTRGRLHPQWQPLACRHSGNEEEIHTSVNYMPKRQICHMTYICHMKVTFINLVTD